MSACQSRSQLAVTVAALTASLLVGLGTARAQLDLYYEDFEDATLAGNTTLTLGNVAAGQADFLDDSTTTKGYVMVRATPEIQFTSPVMTFSFDTVAPVTLVDGLDNELMIRGGPGTSNSMLSSSQDVFEVILFRSTGGGTGGGSCAPFLNNGNESLFVVVNNQAAELSFNNPVDSSSVLLAGNSYIAYLRDNNTGTYAQQKGATALDSVDGSMAIDRFGIGNSSNAYQGAFSLDNVLVSDAVYFGGALQQTRLRLLVDPIDGDVSLMNPTDSPISLNSYRIASETSLNNGQWSPISGQNISGFPAGNGTGNGWEVGPNVSSSELVEWYLSGDSTLAAGDSIYLGHAYNPSIDVHDLKFRYGSGDTEIAGSVLYEPFVPNVGAVAGDYNGNGVVDAADYTVWRNHLGQTFQLTNEGPGQTPGMVTPEDYSFWKTHFGETASGSGAAAQRAVPEPSTWCLLLTLTIAVCGSRFAVRDR